MSPKLIAFVDQEKLLVIPFEHVLYMDESFKDERAVVILNSTPPKEVMLSEVQTKRFITEYQSFLSLIESQTVSIKGESDGSPSEQ